MKVVLFCGGLGTRLREYSDTLPKPLVPIGDRPIIWHLMKYYASFGHKDFILCLGYKGLMIKEYFMDYCEWASNDFTLDASARDVELFGTDLDDWRITFVDTGLQASIGQRLMAVRPYLEGEATFLANYSDGLSDLPLDRQLAAFEESGAVASFASVDPGYSFHIVDADPCGRVKRLVDCTTAGIRINGGFFVLSEEIFDHMQWGEELVVEPFSRLVDQGRLHAYRHDGFWGCMDTFKDKKRFDDLHDSGERPWQIWNGCSGTHDR